MASRVLSREVRDKLQRVRPATLGQAARIPGVTPRGAVLDVYLGLSVFRDLLRDRLRGIAELTDEQGRGAGIHYNLLVLWEPARLISPPSETCLRSSNVTMASHSSWRRACPPVRYESSMWARARGSSCPVAV